MITRKPKRPAVPKNDGDTWKERYDKNVAGERALNQVAREQHPVVSGAGGAVGGLLPALATGGTSALPSAGGALTRAASQLPKPTVAQSVAEGALQGAAYGGLYGAGSAEGNPLERMPGAADGALIGGAVGGAVPAVVGGAKGAYSAATSPERSALHQVDRAIQRDGMTGQQFAQKAEDLQQRYPGSAMPADAGGENVQGLLERVAQTPGAGRTQVIPALTERQQGQGQRLGDTLEDVTFGTAQPGAVSSSTGMAPSVGPPLSWTRNERDTVRNAADGIGKASGSERRHSFRAIEETMKQRAREAGPLYEQAYREPVPWTKELEDLFKRPIMQEAYKGAERRAANEGRDFYGKFIDLKDDGTFTVASVPSTGDLDFVKKYLDSKVGTLEKSGDLDEARVIKGIRTKLIGLMDDASPTYRQARASWAGHSQYIEAINKGKTIMNGNVSAEELADELSKMNPSELEAYRIGAVSSIINNMREKKARLPDLLRDLRSPAMRAKVDAMLPDDAARQRWDDTINFEEGVLTSTRRSLGNSATARRMAEMDGAEGIFGDLAVSAFTGTPVGGLFAQVVRRAGKNVRDTLGSKSDAAIADVLTKQGGLDALRGAVRQQAPSVGPMATTAGQALAIGSAQQGTERAPGPKTVPGILPAVRERLAAGEQLDAKALAREMGVIPAVAQRAIRKAQEERQAR
ncbi:hypothetical protein SAMN04244573_03056 [Azotobacter beijerinckii]|uniref:Uncharacterized protein n=1 Tax=Azotobacter beijerinckii TaxID=170623 RepID=A0A1H9M5Z8_9GAMM|nr:hypothetical protein [Azotobacter beijerinckii]SER18907.1 hypothetical protein SAMN04244573_03056 [Azotobacter beijerinckii]